MRLTDDQHRQFIHLYMENRCLWKTDDPDYRRPPARNIALASIVVGMDVPDFDIRECKDKIKNVRSQYCQELKKIRMAERRGQTYEPTLGWFPLVHGFLADHVHASRKQMRALDRELECSDEGEEQMDTEASQPANAQQAKNHRRLIKQLKRQKLDDAQPQEQETEFDLFGRSIAVQLNNMGIKKALQLQLKLQQTITEFRLENHGKGMAGDHPRRQNQRGLNQSQNPMNNAVKEEESDSEVVSFTTPNKQPA